MDLHLQSSSLAPATGETLRTHDDPLSVAVTLAAPYSGSTLFAILLARHSQLSSDGEIFPWGQNNSVMCSCGLVQIECPYYREAAAHFLEHDGNDWDTGLFAPHPTYSRFGLIDRAAGRLWGNGLLRRVQFGLRSTIPAWRRKDNAFVSTHLQFMRNSLRLRHARVYVDGTKSMRRAQLLAESGRVRMRVIQLVRDGRGFCFSYLKNNDLPRTKLPQAARTWLRNIAAVDHFRAAWPHVPVLDIRYEDLCRDLTKTLHRVCNFLEVPYEPALEDPEARPPHVMGNRMRLNFTGQVEECLRWQREFTSQESEFLNRKLRWALQRYDYPL